MKKLLSLCMALCLALTLAACGGTTATQSGSFTIEDQSGRSVSFEQPAQTAASGYYIATTSLIGLGCEDALVGVEMKADTRKIYSTAAPQILELPGLGNKKSFNVEECAAADPDVVFLPIALKDYVSQLEELDMKVVLLNPETKESYDEAIEIIAKVMGKEDRAQEYFEYREKLLKNNIQEQSDKKRVYFAGSDILEAAGNNMFQSELIRDAQGEYVMADQLAEAANWQNINVEELIKADPEYIFIEQGGPSAEDVLNDPALSEITAVKNKQVYVFPSEYETWDTPNLSSCLGTLWMYAILYPDALSLDQVAQQANDFYQKFYNFDAKLSFES